MFDNSQLGLIRQDELAKARIESIFGQTLMLDEDDFQKAIQNNTIEVYTEEGLMLFKSDLAKRLSESNDLTPELEKAKKDLSKLVKTTVIGKDGVKRTVWIKRKEYKSHTEHNVEEIKATIKRQESLIANPKSPASAVARAKKILEVERAKLKGGKGETMHASGKKTLREHVAARDKREKESEESNLKKLGKFNDEERKKVAQSLTTDRSAKIPEKTKEGASGRSDNNINSTTSINDLESKVPGYLRMKERIEYSAAKSEVRGFRVTPANKGQYDSLVRNEHKKREAYQSALKAKLVTIPNDDNPKDNKPKKGDKLKMGGKTGTVVSVGSDQSQVDFGNGDSYGIMHNRIKDGVIDGDEPKVNKPQADAKQRFDEKNIPNKNRDGGLNTGKLVKYRGDNLQNSITAQAEAKKQANELKTKEAYTAASEMFAHTAKLATKDGRPTYAEDVQKTSDYFKKMAKQS